MKIKYKESIKKIQCFLTLENNQFIAKIKKIKIIQIIKMKILT